MAKTPLTLRGQIPGTITNDSALAGYVGEYLSNSTTGVSSGSDAYVTAASINFSGVGPGDFDVSASYNVANSITTSSDKRGTVLLSDTTDASSSGQTAGFSLLNFTVETGSGGTSQSVSGLFPTIRLVWDGTNIILHRGASTETITGSTIAVRVYCGVYTVGGATVSGFISARRRR